MSTFGSDASYNFLDYARMQHEIGVELAQRHAPEATGCCRFCGRVFPCDGYVDGQHMQAHYLTYLPGQAPPDQAPTDLAVDRAPGVRPADAIRLAEPHRAPDLRFGV